MECIWFVFANFLQHELDSVTEEWNNHYIRRSKSTKVAGIPDELFYLPESRGYNDQGIPQSRADIDRVLFQQNVHKEAEEALNIDDKELSEYFYYVINNEALTYPPRDWTEAKTLYEILVERSGC